MPVHIERGDMLPVNVALHFVPSPATVDVDESDVVPFSRRQLVFDAQLVSFARFRFHRRYHQAISDEMTTIAKRLACAESESRTTQFRNHCDLADR